MGIDVTAIALLIGLFVFLILIKVPVAFSLAISAFVTGAYAGIPLGALTQKMLSGVDSFSLLAIPFFILASMFFGALQGSAIADVASIGPIELRMMKKAGYPDDFSVCVTIASACQSPLIPPSHNMIIFASAIGGVSVGKLFMAGLIPGVLLGVAIMIQCLIISVIRGYPKGGAYTFKEAVKIIAGTTPALLTVVIIVGGVFGGIVTANESAVVACVWAFIISLFFYRGITVKDIWPILRRVLGTLAMVLTLIAASSAFGYMMTILRLPSLITEGLLSISQNRIVLLLLINVSLLLLGCIMDMAPLILICAPILLPVVTGPIIGMDPVQFGVVMILNLSIGLLTPPVGTVLFVGSSISGQKIEKVAKAMLPFYFTMIVTLLLLTFVPAFSMTVPNLMFGK